MGSLSRPPAPARRPSSNESWELIQVEGVLGHIRLRRPHREGETMRGDRKGQAAASLLRASATTRNAALRASTAPPPALRLLILLLLPLLLSLPRTPFLALTRSPLLGLLRRL